MANLTDNPRAALNSNFDRSGGGAFHADPMVQSDVSLQWDLIIRPTRHLLDVNLTEIWRYRDLLLMFVKRDIVTVYKQTVLGPIWFFVQPVLTMAVYVLVFANIAQLSTDNIPAPLFYLAGIVMWNYFADTFTKTSTTFISNAHIFGKVYFPRLLVPLSIVLSGLIKFAIQLCLFVLLFLYYYATHNTLRPNVWLLSIFYLLLLLAALGLGCGIIITSLTSKYRDLTFLVQFGIQLAMYATPVIYPMSVLSAKARAILWWNPFAHIIEAFKFAFFGSGQATVTGMVYSTLFASFTLLIGIVIFNRTEQSFMDTI